MAANPPPNSAGHVYNNPDKICMRCNKKVYAAENPITVKGADVWSNVTYHSSCFKCKSCNVKLTLINQTTKYGDVWCSTHIPYDKPSQIVDVTIGGQVIYIYMHSFCFFI